MERRFGCSHWLYEVMETWGVRKIMTVGVILLACALATAFSGCASGDDKPTPEPPTDDDGEPTDRVADAAEEARMRRHIQELQQPEDVRHSFTLVAGDAVDCVDVRSQPSLRAPDMSGHRIAVAPATGPGGAPPADEDLSADLLRLHGEPDELGRARRCPDGTIPIQRLTMEQLRRFRTLADFRRKVPGHLTADDEGAGPFDTGLGRGTGGTGDVAPPRLGPTDSHQYAWTQRAVDNLGAESRINLWSPYVEKPSEFSLSQIWVSRGSGASLETVEVGVQKFRNLYGDDVPRLFIYFTPDNYGSGGCYNLTCSGFVQTNGSIVIGGPFASYSTAGGSQYEVKALWYKDGTAGNWWLRIGDIWVGYYPRNKFDAAGLQERGASIAFGGEIIDHEPAYHTITDMGSGAFPSAGWQQAAYQRQILYVSTSNFYTDPGALTGHRTDAACYDIALANDPGNWGRYFFYGGPGYNASCE